jgi:hypothetical protein
MAEEAIQQLSRLRMAGVGTYELGTTAIKHVHG